MNQRQDMGRDEETVGGPTLQFSRQADMRPKMAAVDNGAGGSGREKVWRGVIPEVESP